MELAVQAVNGLVAAKVAAMLDSGCQLLPRPLATQRVMEARCCLASAECIGSICKDTVLALSAAVEQRISALHLYSANDMEAIADMVGLYLEFDDCTCHVDEKLQQIKIDMRAAPRSPNSVVQGAMSPSSCRMSCTASTGHANSLKEATATKQAPFKPY